MAILFETWIGPTYVSGLAGEMGISSSFMALLAAIPSVGSAGILVGTWAFEQVDSVRSFTLRVASAARSLWLLPLFLAVFWGVRQRCQGVTFPVNDWFIALAVTSSLSAFFSSSSLTAWIFWMKGTVPTRFQGRFFGGRQRYTALTLVLANLIAAALVGWKPQGYRVGSVILASLALVAGGLSILLHSRVPDLPLRTTAERKKMRDVFGPALRDGEFRKLLFFGAAFNGAIQLGSSFFPYFFTKDLGIAMSTVAIWIGVSNIGCFLVSAYWGKIVDRPRAPYSILWLTGNMVALSPLLYVFPSAHQIRWIAPFDYLMNGAFWAGFIVSQTALLMKASVRGKSAAYFSLYTAACGLSGAICTFLGGNLAHLLAPWGGFRALFLFCGLARFAALWFFCRPLTEPSARPVLRLLRFQSE